MDERNKSNLSNRNARRTRKLIQEAYIELMKEKQYYKITVRELTEKADINRSTFYRHYIDLDDLMDDIQKGICEDVHNTVAGIKREGYEEGKHPFHVKVFEALKEHEEKCMILSGPNGETEFIYRLLTAMGDAMYDGWSSYYKDDVPEDLPMYVSYSVFGILGLFLKNLQPGYRWSAAEMGHLAGEVTNWLDEGIRERHGNTKK
jgi:AcrR family transcriptional regulator